MCRSNNKSMIISSSWHPFISLVFHPFSYNILYLFWYTTSYSCTFFMMLMWSYHRWFEYPFVMLPVREWAHYSPWYASKYRYNYHIEEWSSCTKRGFLPFSLPHMEMSKCCHHQKQFSNIVIVDLTRTDLVQCASMMIVHATIVTTQDKTWSYTKWMPRNDFIPLAIETSFIHASIAHHKQTSLVPSMLISYYRQSMSIALQCAQVIAIFQRAAMFNHSFSSFPPIPSAPPSLIDLW